MRKIVNVIISSMLLISISPTVLAAATPTTDSSAQIVQLNTQIQEQIKQLQAQQQQQITTLNTQLQNQIKQLQTTLQDQVQKLNSQTEAKIQQVQTTLQTQISQVQAEVNQLKKS